MFGGDLMKTWLCGKHAGRCLVALTACGLIACSEDRGQDGIDQQECFLEAEEKERLESA